VTSEDGGPWKFLPAPERLPLAFSNQDPITGRVDVVARSAGSWFAYQLDLTIPFQFPQPQRLDRQHESWSGCRAGDVLWAVASAKLYRSDRRETRTFELPPGLTLANPSDCREDSVLVESLDRVVICREDGCRAVRSHRARAVQTAGAFLDDGRWVHVEAVGGVVAVWEQSLSSPLLYQLERDHKLLEVAVLRGNIYLLVTDSDLKLRLVSLPTPRNP
jgi:hypothetical protein